MKDDKWYTRKELKKEKEAKKRVRYIKYDKNSVGYLMGYKYFDREVRKEIEDIPKKRKKYDLVLLPNGEII